MALPIEFCTVVFKKTQLSTRFPGGLDAFFAFCSAPSYLEDDHLVRISFMATHEAHAFIERIAHTLQREAAQDLHSVVVDRSSASDTMPPWLMTGTIDDTLCVWMAGVAPGPVTQPARCLAARFLSIPIARFRDELGTLGIVAETSMDVRDANTTLVRGPTRIDAILGTDDQDVLIGLITFPPKSRIANPVEHEKLLVDVEAALHRLGWNGHE